MKRWLSRMLPIAAAVLVVAACGSAGDPVPRPASQADQEQDRARFVNTTREQLDDRLIVREAEVALSVADVASAVQTIAVIATEHGGRVQASSTSGEVGDARGVVVLRVPSGRFDQVMNDIQAVGDRVESIEVSSEDVSEEYVDLQARVTNLEATESQLQSFMDRAETIDEVLDVQRELTDVREEIERLTGRMQFLAQTAAESRIAVTLQPVGAQGPLVRQDWSGLETAKGAVQGLITTLQVVADIAIYVGTYAPVWAPIAVAGFWWYRRERRIASRRSDRVSMQ